MRTDLIKSTPDGVLIRIRIVPNSSRNEIILEEEFIKVKVTAQPIENKANKALIEFLSKQFKLPKTKTFKIPKSSFEIIKGETSKDKTIILSTQDENKKTNIISQLTK